MNVLVIEFEKMMVQKIKDLLYEIDDSITIVGVTGDMPSAASWLKLNEAPDLILANTEMIADIDKNDEREIKARVTISTQGEEFKFEAFRFKHLRYILNNLPVTAEQLSRKHFAGHQPGKTQTLSPNKERFLVKQGQKLVSVHVSHIAYFFSEGRFIFLKTFNNQKYLVEYRIEHLEKVLSPGMFFRVNRSHIISLSTVKEIHAYFGNRFKLYLSPSTEKDIIVSRKRVADFKAWLGK